MKLLLPLVLLVTSCKAQSNSSLSNSDCESPDAPVECSFIGVPGNISSHTVIAENKDGTEKLVVSGRITNASGKALDGVVLYVYHTDHKGIYSKNGKETGAQKWHGQYHGWVKTGNNGEYSFQTIRPASYPNSNAPQHIHAAVKLPGGQIYWISDFLFGDDPNLGSEAPPNRLPGKNEVMTMKKDPSGTWKAERNIIL